MLAVCAVVSLAGCRRDMQDQPKYKPLALSRFFADGRSARPIPAGTIATDELNDTDLLHTGMANGTWTSALPVPVDLKLMQRGRERYDIYCSPCHSRTGDGNGMIYRRGLWRPADLLSERVRQVPPGYIFDVITNGFGAMGDYRDQIQPADRWAIVAYLRALELSRNASIADVPEDARRALGERK